MRLHDCNGDSCKAYRSLEEAIAAFEDDYGEDAYEKDSDCGNCSLGVGIDQDGNEWFVVADMHYFTNCYKEDLHNWKNWYEDEWVEREDN